SGAGAGQLRVCKRDLLSRTERGYSPRLSVAASAASRDRDWLITSRCACRRCASASGISTCTVTLIAEPPSSGASCHWKTRSETRQEIVTPDAAPVPAVRSCCGTGKSGYPCGYIVYAPAPPDSTEPTPAHQSGNRPGS